MNIQNPTAKRLPLQAAAHEAVIRKGPLPETVVVEWLRDLRGRPFVEQSGFDVTSVLKIRAEGEIYHVAGVNVENAELTVGTCAEEGALGAAATAFGEHFEVLEGWVMGAPRDAASSDLTCYPCGECRQRLAQYAAPEAPFHIIALDGEQKDVKTRAELLPLAFSFRDLEREGEAVAPPAVATHAEARDSYDSRLVRVPGQPLTTGEIAGWLDGLHSDVRVSGEDRRLVLRLGNGAYVAGVKMENAAYPSSTSAIQVAVALMNALFGVQAVEEVWTLVRHREAGKDEAQREIPAPVSGAVLQVLHQFAAHQDIPVHLLTPAGQTHRQMLSELPQGQRAFSRFSAE